MALGSNLALPAQRANFAQQRQKFVKGPKPRTASCLHAPVRLLLSHRDLSLISQPNTLTFLMMAYMLLPPQKLSLNSPGRISLPSPGCPGAQITYAKVVDFW